MPGRCPWSRAPSSRRRRPARSRRTLQRRTRKAACCRERGRWQPAGSMCALPHVHQTVYGGLLRQLICTGTVSPNAYESADQSGGPPATRAVEPALSQSFAGHCDRADVGALSLADAVSPHLHSWHWADRFLRGLRGLGKAPGLWHRPLFALLIARVLDRPGECMVALSTRRVVAIAPTGQPRPSGDWRRRTDRRPALRRDLHPRDAAGTEHP